MHGHRLRREIISTTVANALVDRAGTTFAFRLTEETGASVSALARSYTVAREVLDMRSLWQQIEALDNQIDAHEQLAMLIGARRLVERSTRWLVRGNPQGVDIASTISYFEPGARMLAGALPDVLAGADREEYDTKLARLREAGIPDELARRVAGMSSMVAVFDIVELATTTRHDLATVMSLYFRLGARLELNWLRDRILELPRTDRWRALARAALRDDLNTAYRELTHEVLDTSPAAAGAEIAIDDWLRRNAAAVERALSVIADIRASRVYDTTTLPVALREVRNLVRDRSALHSVPGAMSVTMAG